MREMTRSPYVLVLGIAASLFAAVSCSDDEDDGGGSNNGGSSGSSGKGGSSGSAGKGGSSGKGGSTNGGSTNGGSTNGGSSGSAGGPTGGTSGSGGTAGTGGDGGVGGDMTDGGMGGVGTDGGMGGEGGEMVVADVLDNSGFEMFGIGGKLDPIPGWMEGGDLEATFLEWDGGLAGAGDHKLVHWRAWVATTAETFTASTFQTVGPIPNGTYSFSLMVKRKLALTEQYLFARGHNLANPSEQVTQTTGVSPSESAFVQVTLGGIQVTSGQVTVGIHTASWGNDWAHFDGAALTKDP